MRKQSWSGVIGLAVCLIWTLPASAQFLEGKVIQHQLENGLTLLMYERHQTPIIACHVYVNAGSANDKLGETGIAHITEHIAFKGTNTLGTTDYDREKILLDTLDNLWRELAKEQEKGKNADQERLKQLKDEFTKTEQDASQYVVSEEYSRIIEQNGGVGLNASTSRDETRYFVSLPANRLELWMMLEADRLANTVPREFYKERDVVMEERRMRTDASPVGTLVEQFLGAAFIAHPYGLPGIGWTSDIQNAMPDQLMKFFQDYYAPGNLTVAVVGDIQPNEVIRLSEKYFGQLPARPVAQGVHTIEPAQPGERRVTVEWESNPYILIGYHRPGINHDDDLVFDMISLLLSYGRTSKLYKHLVDEQQLAVSVQTISAFPAKKYPSLFVVVGVPLAPHTLDELEKSLDAEIEQLKTTPITDKELQKIRNNVEASFIESLSSNSGLAAQLTLAQNTLGDWRAIERQIERMKTITAQDIMRVAHTYFTKQNRTIAWLVKK